MRKWKLKCKVCNRYIMVSYQNIFLGCQVSFKVYEHNGVYARYKRIVGMILHKNNGLFYVVSDLDFYVLSFFQIYPVDAPVRFLYNMFGVCDCKKRK